jgi:hypothetical protein
VAITTPRRRPRNAACEQVRVRGPWRRSDKVPCLAGDTHRSAQPLSDGRNPSHRCITRRGLRDRGVATSARYHAKRMQVSCGSSSSSAQCSRSPLHQHSGVVFIHPSVHQSASRRHQITLISPLGADPGTKSWQDVAVRDNALGLSASVGFITASACWAASQAPDAQR